jgi:hypothetical protein
LAPVPPEGDQEKVYEPVPPAGVMEAVPSHDAWQVMFVCEVVNDNFTGSVNVNTVAGELQPLLSLAVQV